MTKKTNTNTRSIAKRLSLACFALFTVATAWANPVDETAALQRARAFVESRGMAQLQPVGVRLAVKGHRAQARAAAPADYYVFNLDREQGFVIVSGDDRTTPILGYADQGSIDADDMPDGLRYLLDGYAEQVAWLDTHADTADDADAAQSRSAATARMAAARTAISPLIETHWNQDSPYNDKCPEITYTEDGKEVTEHCASGCVATAMAQVMYYHKYPTEACTAIPGYTSRNGNHTLTQLAPTTFNWSTMTTTYTSTSSEDAKTAVATLMKYCGQALQMNYGKSSGAFNATVADALKAYFGYDQGIDYVLRKFYTYEEWIDMIYNELHERRPVVLGGQSTGGGHSFVCDGYDTDDYFHINWGWGGSSDGYFRLTSLAPSVQGIGGSSSLDGFSYGQEAVIGIQKGTPTQQTCLSLEALQFTDSDTSTTRSFNRDSGNGYFTEIPLYFLLFNYLPSGSFDIAVQLTDGTTTTDLATAEDQSINYTAGSYFSFTLYIPPTVKDGTYYLIIASRPHGETYWQPCYGISHSRIKAEIADGTLTLTAPCAVLGSGATPSCTEIATSDKPTLGYEVEVTAKIKGGSLDYHDELHLYVDGKNVMGRQADVPAGKTVDVRFTYTPTKAGDNVLAIYAGKNNKLLEETITIATSDASNTQTISVAPTIENLADGKLYGNALHVKVTVKNPSTENSFVSRLNCSLRKYDSKDAAVGDYVNATVKSQSVIIEKSEGESNLSTAEVSFSYDGLEAGKAYRLRFTYTQGYTEDGTAKTRTAEALITEAYEMGEGYALYAADGTTTIQPKGDNITAGNACFVDLTAISKLKDITISASTNPNCLYLLASDAETPEGINNVVKGTTAENITLHDGHDFFTPIAFTAEKISYSRTFDLPAGGSEGWNTIMLPFTVETITVADGSASGKTVDWFHSGSDTGKNFWLRTFTGDATGSVYFDYATSMTAMTPYIIAVPGDTWDDEWQMTGKAVTFSGTNAAIAATTEGSLSGNSYKFCGSTIAPTLSDVYVLNAEGSKFGKTATVNDGSQSGTALPAFRAWFSPVSISSLTLPSLSIGSGYISGIDTVSSGDIATPANGWYTLDGRHLDTKPSTKGLYINNGKKIVIR